jgi:non-reducing end alpha-L-arabinofuranosidase
MRNRLVGLVGFLAGFLALASLTLGGCSGSSSLGGATGGTPGSGGSAATGGTGGTSSCPGGTSCGGSVVGTWDVTSSCLSLSGDWDVTLASFGCKTVPVSGSLHVTGSWTAKSDGTYVDNTVTTGSVTFPLSPACLSISSVPIACSKGGGAITPLGWSSATCANDSNGNCICTATANQSGGMGVVSPWAMPSGDYAVSGSSLSVDSAENMVGYSYCASGSDLTVTPKPTVLPLSGTIVLHGRSSGSGGSSGTGGTTGSGGTTSSGGSNGSGGASSTGGSGGKGGSTGTGGTTATGGSTGSGGSAGNGGSGGTAGSTGSGGAAGKGGTGGTSATGGSTGASGASGMGPCDIFAAANTACVAAHSTVRALLGAYSGPLYKVKRASDSTTKDIGVVSTGGLADTATQDAFCSGTTCTITMVYDQSGHGNLVEAETPDSTVGGHSGMTASNATQESLTLNGHKVYSLYMKTSQAYWRDGSKSGMPLGSSPQGIYMVTSGKHVGSGCCFDYGNGETNRMYVAGPSMDALNFSTCTIWGTGAGAGPWVMADLEGGLYAKGGGGQSTADPSLTYTYVTAMEKNNGTGTFALKGADATTGSLSTFYSGAVPPGYNPAKKQGSIVLGSGGDCCYSNNTASQGTFYEGAIVAGYPTDATDSAIQANIVMAGYGK